MGQSRQKKYDTIRSGFTWGIALPLALFLVIYLIRYREIPVFRFLSGLQEMKILFKILSLCGFANILTFLFLYRRRMDKAARGVIAATILFALLTLVSLLF